MDGGEYFSHKRRLYRVMVLMGLCQVDPNGSPMCSFFIGLLPFVHFSSFTFFFLPFAAFTRYFHNSLLPSTSTVGGRVGVIMESHGEPLGHWIFLR